MSILNAIFQGIIQGLTEFLPVSSSGHLSIFQHFTGQSGESAALFSVLLHFGTLIAVFIAFRKTIGKLIIEFCRMVGDIFRGRFTMKQANPERRMIVLLIVSLLPLLVFVWFKDFFTSISSDQDILVEGVCFIITGCLLMMADRCMNGRKTAATMRYKDAVAMGVAQGVAMMPAISRSGATISAGMMCGLTRSYAVQFSFIMGIPTVLAANVLEIKDAVSTGMWGTLDPVVLIAGLLTAAVVGFFAICLVSWLIKTNKFKIFAYYTLTLGAIVTAIGLLETVGGVDVVSIVAGWF